VADQAAPGKTPRRPWVTGIRSPRAPDGPVAQVLRIHRDCAVATSGDYEQYFLWQGRRYSHILDPRSGRPLSGGVVSATVVLPGACMTADALATAASVLGVDGARELLANFPAAEAWLIRADGSMVHLPAAAQAGKSGDVTISTSSQR
ncbi:MAG: FAD:protein FMN transferase, partial [Planctomycetes bacterium]|nr:FAD:protein FMN transferase [Planctomycetota bacterium]